MKLAPVSAIPARPLRSYGRRQGFPRLDWVIPPKCSNRLSLESSMTWTKPEAEVVAVTMEVTAYVATL